MKKCFPAIVLAGAAAVVAVTASAQTNLQIVAGVVNQTATPALTCKSVASSLIPSDQGTTAVPLCNFGYSGDGQAAVNAALDYPLAAAADSSGNLYIVDAGNEVIRQVSPSGVITTIGWVDGSGGTHQGTPPGKPGTSGVGSYPTAFPSAIAFGSGGLQVGTTSSGVTGAGAALAMTSDSAGNVYALNVVEGTQYSITKNGASVFSVIATAGFAGLAVDAAGNIYTVGTAGAFTGDIVQIAPGSTSPVVVVNASGQPTLANFPNNGLAIDANNNLYALGDADADGSPVLFEFLYNPTTQAWASTPITVAGTGANAFNGSDAPQPATTAALNHATGVTIAANGAIYITDTGNNMVRAIGEGSGVGCHECGPSALTLTDAIPTGRFTQYWALDRANHLLYVVYPQVGAVVAFNTQDDTVAANILVGKSPAAIAVDSDRNFVYVLNEGDHSVSVINGATNTVENTLTLPGQPFALALDTALNKAYILLEQGGSAASPSVPAVSVVTGPSGVNPAAVTAAIGAASSTTPLPGSTVIASDPVRNRIYVRFVVPGGSGFNYSLAVIDATSDTVLRTPVVGTRSSSQAIYANSLAVNVGTGDVVVGDDFDTGYHVFTFATQSFTSTQSSNAAATFVAVDGANNLEYFWDGNGNSSYLDLNASTGGLITTQSLATTCGIASGNVAFDSETTQVYVTSCDTSAGARLTLFDSFNKTTVATLSLGASEFDAAYPLLVDTSSATPTAHTAYIENFVTSQIDVINGPAAPARPSLQFASGLNSFQTVGVGQTAGQVIGVQNNGPAAMKQLNLVAQSGPDPGALVLGGFTCNTPLAAGAGCHASLNFTPSQVESFSGSLYALDDAADTPQVFSISGAGVPDLGSLTLSPNALPAGFVAQAYSANFTVSGLVGSPNFNLLNGSLPPGLALAGNSITGTPTLAGTYTFTVGVTDTGSIRAGSQLYVVTILASGATVPSASLTGTVAPGVLAFGPIQFGEISAPKAIQLRAVTAQLQITGIAILGPNAGDFSESDTCIGSAVVSCNIAVTFSPRAAPVASEAAQLVIESNGSVAPVYLTGTSASTLGAPSLPVAVSLDNANPPNLAQALNPFGCAPPDCGGSGTTSLGGISSGGQSVVFSFGPSNLPSPSLAVSTQQLSGAFLRRTCVGAASGCQQNTQFFAYGPASGPGANGGLACVANLGLDGSFATGIDSGGANASFEGDSCGFTGSTFQNAYQVFLRNFASSSTQLISVDASGSPANKGASGSSMSANAQYFAFQSQSDNVVAGVTNTTGNFQVYWRDNTAGTDQLASAASAGAMGNGDSTAAFISPSGRYVAFASKATNLASSPADTDTTGLQQVYLYDTCAGAPTGSNCKPGALLISVDAAGKDVGGNSPAVSFDGRFVVFLSGAPSLISLANTSSISTQVFLRDTCLSNGATVPAPCTPQTILVSQAAGQPGVVNSSSPTISADGSLVLFNTASNNLNPQVLFNSVPTFKAVNCLAPGAAAGCNATPQVITVDASGAQLQNVTGPSLVDATGQFFIFGTSVPGQLALPPNDLEVYLAPTSAAGPLTILPPSPLQAWLDELLTVPFTTSGGSGTATFTAPTGLPAWLSWNAATNTLSGTPNTTAAASFSLTAADASGTVTQPYTVTVGDPLALSPSPVNFGSVQQGTNLGMALTITNVSPSPMIFQAAAYAHSNTPFGFASTGSTCAGTPLPNGQSCRLVLLFSPTSVGPAGDNLNLLFSNGAMESVGVEGTGAAPPPLSFTPAAVPGGYLGEAYGVTFNAVNPVGATSWLISGTPPSGLLFTPGQGSAMLSGFPTGAAGTYNFAIQLTDSAGSVTQNYSIVVADPTVISPLIVQFGSSPIGVPAVQSIQLGNSSPGSLTLGGTALPTGSPYSVLTPGTTCTPGAVVPPGGTCVYQVQFQPTGIGLASANLVAQFDTAGDARSILLQGTGVLGDSEQVTVSDTDAITPLIQIAGPELEFSSGGLGFGSPAAGTTVNQTLLVSAAGLQPVTINSVAVTAATAPFSITAIVCSTGASSVPVTLPSGGQCVLTVSYTASASPAGDTASLVFNDSSDLSNLPTTPAGSAFTQTLSLSGAGAGIAAPPPPPASLSLNDTESIQVVDQDGPVPLPVSFTWGGRPTVALVGTQYEVTFSLINRSGVALGLQIAGATLATASSSAPFAASAVGSVASAASIAPGASASFTLFFPLSAGPAGRGALKINAVWSFGPASGNYASAVPVILP